MRLIIISQLSCSVMSDSLQPHGLQQSRLPCPSPNPGAYSNSFPLSGWCYPTISPSVVPFSSCLQFFPASGSFQMGQFFTSGGQSIGTSASVLPINIQDWFPLGLSGLTSLESKGLSRVFSDTTVQKHQFFHAQLSLWTFSNIRSDKIRSVAQSCPILCDPMNHSTPGLPVSHKLQDFTETQVHWVSDAIQPSHPLSSPSPPAPNPSQYQSLFQWVNSSHEVAKVLEFQL